MIFHVCRQTAILRVAVTVQIYCKNGQKDVFPLCLHDSGRASRLLTGITCRNLITLCCDVSQAAWMLPDTVLCPDHGCELTGGEGEVARAIQHRPSTFHRPEVEQCVRLAHAELPFRLSASLSALVFVLFRMGGGVLHPLCLQYPLYFASLSCLSE